MEEETGYRGRLELVYDFYSAIGFCNEKIKLYSASYLTKVDNPRPQDEDETLEIVEVTLEEARELLASGDICDAKTIMALQYWEAKMNK
ncbi:ADP-ribose pyrophosphatase [Streptococcus sp. DD11]|nr:ADP-ribose pyrophosphatase [Streptococcus sp. DD11]